MPRLIIAEVSKVRHYHSTVTDGFLKAWQTVGADVEYGRPRVFAHQSFLDCLSPESRNSADCETIPVIDPDKRWLLRKTLLEAWVTLKIALTMKRDDVLIVATIFPTALVLIEWIFRLLPKRHIVILQHNEVEAAIAVPRPRLGSYGHANLVWHRMRGRRSALKIAVLGSWIADGIRKYYRGSVAEDELFVLPMPMTVHRHTPPQTQPAARLRCCFVGFNTAGKGFDVFQSLATDFPDHEFLQIGGGIMKDLHTEEKIALDDTVAFVEALASCDVAIMPNSSGYDYTLSAAATDAIASGLHLLAYDRGCFRAMQAAFGESTVTICSSIDQLHDKLGSPEWIRMVRTDRTQRLDQVERSEFGLRNVGNALKRVFNNVPG